jgi:hypothetical protein
MTSLARVRNLIVPAVTKIFTRLVLADMVLRGQTELDATRPL